jgi:hypothetical protein
MSDNGRVKDAIATENVSVAPGEDANATPINPDIAGWSELTSKTKQA